MIRAIAAIDEKQGIANDKGIPWQGKLPADVAYFRGKTRGQSILMGFVMYTELLEPLPDRYNYVATSSGTELRQGFRLADNVDMFVENFEGNLWLVGGAGLYASTIKYADELCITQLKGDFGCTKFFPEFKDEFELVSEDAPITENGITFTFQKWRRKH
jgi:dihydrofolate reductase